MSRFRKADCFYCGSQFMDFDTSFCDRCDTVKRDEYGSPISGSCPTYDMLTAAYIDSSLFDPRDVLVQDDTGRHICLSFFSNNDDIMDAFTDLISEEVPNGPA